MSSLGCWSEIVWVTSTVYLNYTGQCIPTEPADHNDAVALPALQHASMPRQRLRSIPKPNLQVNALTIPKTGDSDYFETPNRPFRLVACRYFTDD
jgi:hypothetical protein